MARIPSSDVCPGTGRRSRRGAACLALAAVFVLGACEDFALGTCDPSRLGSAPTVSAVDARDLAVAVADARTRFVPRLGSAAVVGPLDDALGQLGTALSAGDMPGACEAYNQAVGYYQSVAHEIQIDSATIMDAEVVRLTLGVVEGSLLSLIRR
jgi:hypothetical protein